MTCLEVGAGKGACFLRCDPGAAAQAGDACRGDVECPPGGEWACTRDGDCRSGERCTEEAYR